MTTESLVRTLEEFLGPAEDALVLEGGAVLFDLAQARYSVSGEHNKCLLHLWSAERNIVRRVLDLEIRNEVLRIAVQPLGQTRPGRLEICRERDRRTSSARRAARMAYQRLLHRVLERRFPEYKIAQFTTAVDLARSFGPIYTRGLLRRGQSSFAVLGVNSQETQAAIDGALTFGILWLDLCRQNQSGKSTVEGLKLILPARTSALARERAAMLHPDAARWQLWELEERDASLQEIDITDRGNISTRLVPCADEAAVRDRLAEPIARVRALMPECAAAAISPSEVAFRCQGLEFARARLSHAPRSFSSVPEIVFGIGAQETLLTPETEEAFVRLICSIGEVRHPDGPRDHPFWRFHPERWLESLAIGDIAAIDDRLTQNYVYSQVPAFSASDRAMVDVLTTTHSGRLAVVELKADEDIHLPLQGLDYWSRVAWHHSRGEFQRFAYFPGQTLSPQPPLLFLLAPALRVHPATDTLLRYISREIEWTLVGIDERWRHGIRPVFRKRGPGGIRQNLPRFASDALRLMTE